MSDPKETGLNQLAVEAKKRTEALAKEIWDFFDSADGQWWLRQLLTELGITVNVDKVQMIVADGLPVFRSLSFLNRLALYVDVKTKDDFELKMVFGDMTDWGVLNRQKATEAGVTNFDELITNSYATPDKVKVVISVDRIRYEDTDRVFVVEFPDVASVTDHLSLAQLAELRRVMVESLGVRGGQDEG